MNYVFSDRMAELKPSAIREIFKSLSDPSMISFSGGNPAPESFPVEELAALSREVYERHPSAALQYGITEGYGPLREQVKARLRSRFGIGGPDDEVIIVTGGQQGLELSCKVLCNEGDVVLCENPSFIGALNAFRSYGVTLRGIPIEEDGMNMDELERALSEESRVRFIYTIPTFQNPAGVTMSLEKRKRLYELARKHDVLILEDNPYGELRFSGEDVPTIKSMDEDGRVIYDGSFSKIVAPGIRLGFVCAPSEVISKIVVAKQISDVHSNAYFQLLVSLFLERYDLDEHIERICGLYRGKCQRMLDAADRFFDPRVTVTRPEGGLFLWATLPEGADMPAFCKAALSEKVAVVPGSSFMARPEDLTTAVRLNYSMPSFEQIDKGMEILGRVQRDFLK